MFQRIWVLIAFLASSALAAPVEAKKVAFVIGIDRYPNLSTAAQLTKAVADARAVRKTLSTKLGFADADIVYGENVTLSQAKDLLTSFARKLGPDDIALVYFAGHGMHVRQANYLMVADLPKPRGVSSERELRLEEEALIERALPEERIRELVQLSGARFGILIIDACRNNFLSEAAERAGLKLRGINVDPALGPRPIPRPIIPAGRTQFLTLYSASPGQQALDGLGAADRNANSPFTRVLVERLVTPGAKLFDMMRALRTEVAQLANSIGHSQVPHLSEEALDEIVLLDGTPATSPAAAVASPTPVAPRAATAPPPPAPTPTPPSAADADPPEPPKKSTNQRFADTAWLKSSLTRIIAPWSQARLVDAEPTWYNQPQCRDDARVGRFYRGIHLTFATYFLLVSLKEKGDFSDYRFFASQIDSDKPPAEWATEDRSAVVRSWNAGRLTALFDTVLAATRPSRTDREAVREFLQTLLQARSFYRNVGEQYFKMSSGPERFALINKALAGATPPNACLEGHYGFKVVLPHLKGKSSSIFFVPIEYMVQFWKRRDADGTSALAQAVLAHAIQKLAQ